MFYYAAKLFKLLLLPSSFIFLLIAAGLFLLRFERRRRLGVRLIAAAAGLMLILGFSPFGNVLIMPLEQRFAAVPAPGNGDDIAGIILLGGFEDGWVTKGRGGLGLNESAERLTEAVRLAKRHPEAKLVFTGGSAGLLSAQDEATGAVGQWLRDMGVAAERIVLEARSRDTHENAVFTRDLVAPKAGERWLLVTSAYHMPRAVGVFRAAGFDVIAYPVDYRTRGEEDMLRLFERIIDGLKRTEVAFNEWLGLVAYRISGRTTELFPAP